MPATLDVGQLVEVAGLQALDDCPQEWVGVISWVGAAADLNGHRGQVLQFHEASGQWLVATFGALLVGVKEKFLRPLESADVADFDVALGPKSDAGIMGEGMVACLLKKGHALCKLFLSDKDLEAMVAIAEKCVEESLFVRLAQELEPGYLGRDVTGKTMSLDLDDDCEAFIRESPLKVVEDAFASVGQILDPYARSDLGFDIFSRSKSLLALPFDGDEDSYVPPDLENEEAANFLGMMWRSKMMVLVNAGPGVGTLKLFPKVDGDEEFSVTVQPGTLALVLVDRYKFSYVPDGKALTVRCFFLDAPRQYVISNIDENMFDSGALALNAGAPPPSQKDPISVAALCTRYAMGASDPAKLWPLYSKAAFDPFISFPITRWDEKVYYQEDADQNSGLSYTRHGGFSDGIELFDTKFFDISPAEARGMDPTQRQVLEVSYTALADAGWNKKHLQSRPEQIAVFVGLDKNEWNLIPKEASGGFGASSSANAITSNRFSYCMNLKGASMTIDTACSASLVCTHTAKLYILFKQWDPCIASIVCGVNLMLSPLTFVGTCGAGMLSHHGRCFTYNQSADGYAKGESTAAHCLKPEMYDKEKNLALMAGSQVNQDGRSASLTAPNGPSQERCNRAVLREANLSPPEVDACECHGTGTSLGDPIEVGAYQKVMASDPSEAPVCITTCKSNIGHCEGSAGVSGFIKCILMCMNAECCPNCHMSCLNPHLDMSGFPGLILTENLLYKAATSYNGVLSFGFGGTNACAQVYGANVLTTRAAGNKDVYVEFIRKLEDAPPQEVTVTSDDWEEWEMGGPERYSKPGDLWAIEIDEDGEVTYTRMPKEPLDLGDSYYLTGSFNDWGYQALEMDDFMAGLHTGSVTIGPSGQVLFQVVADENPEMTFFPEGEWSSAKSSVVKGPSVAKRDQCWGILGQEGERYRVEFYKAESDSLSVVWVREDQEKEDTDGGS